MSQKYRPLSLGPLPVDAIAPILDLEMEAGTVRLSAQAHRHMAEDHPDDYPVCIAALEAAIASPTFIGQSPRHRDNFELIKRVSATNTHSVLVAVSIERDSAGTYRVRSCYLVSNETVDARRKAGRLRPPKPTT